MQNYELMFNRDRMKDYAENLRYWVVDSKSEADYKAVKAKTNR